MLRYKIAPKCLLPGPFGHSDVGGNPGVAGRFVAIISFLHTPVSSIRGIPITLHHGRRRVEARPCPMATATRSPTNWANECPCCQVGQVYSAATGHFCIGANRARSSIPKANWPSFRRRDSASVAATEPETKCPLLTGDSPAASPLFYNSPPTSAPAGIAGPFPAELSGICS